MEIWDLYNKEYALIGKDHIRGNPLPDGCYHLVVHVWIRNRKGEYLISQRSADRPTYPLMWECVGGSVIKGENSFQGALRETKEEVGISLPQKAGKRVYTKVRDFVDGIRFADILDVWLFEYNGPVDLNDATTTEVAQIAWKTMEEIRILYDLGKFVPTLKYIFEWNNQ